ncbi:CDP-glycerol glycerophosphotransferase family protein [Curtobacterium pusillum]|uniref:bifunctional glycosyltransferase/CDP-glycerol:glycerophosphate glycerophosphotransferase n=1 Tax=Curtobacterium pusillum TaxID=69373 RepID=UPI0011A37607|nr:CDP-glycerol glycerophosphotransferase family protein [Curtobacterium pusillum]
MATAIRATPLISVVVAAHDVARYLPTLLASFERQTIDENRLQFVFVDDGSTDSTGSLLDEWCRHHPANAIVLHQSNKWIADARNAGIAHADGQWLTFVDADDELGERYFEEVAKFIELHASDEVALLAAHQLLLDDDGNVTDGHPSRKRFEKGSRIVDMRLDPIVQTGVNAAFVRRDLVEASQVRFDGRVRPTFEDAHFVARYLLRNGLHQIGLMASAKYRYRQRGDGTSTMQTSHEDRRKYTDVLRHGHLGLLDEASRLGRVDRWVANTVLYDLVGYFRRERAIRSPSALAPVDAFDEFHELASEVLERVGSEAVRSFDLLPVEFAVRRAMLMGYRVEPDRPSTVNLAQVDESHQLVQLQYWFTRDTPEERILVDGHEVDPVFETVQDFVFYGRPLVRRRIIWIPRGHVTEMHVDGQQVVFARGEVPNHYATLTRRQLEPQILGQRRRVADPNGIELTNKQYAWRSVRKRALDVRKALGRTALRDAVAPPLARRGRARERFSRAWVFIDRDTDANDNAEHAYRYVLRHRPDINAFFVLNRDSKDWDRLKREGFRMVAFRSLEWVQLMLHAEHVASSHIADFVTRPLPVAKFGQPRFHFTFLQHGVINYDLSRWLNSKRPDLFVVSTPQEKLAIAGDGQWIFSEHEVVLTGLPRFDALLEKSRAVGQEGRDLILVMPTWRHYLVGAQVAGSGAWERDDRFMESRFAKEYTALMSSPALRELATRTGKRLALMPHPLLRPYLSDFDLPADVEVLDFATTGIQDVLARTAAFVTDFSSLAFDAAFIDVPVVYFHFDMKEFFGGSHSGRRGYFDYDRDGFGEVTSSVEAVERAVKQIAEQGFRPSAAFRKRAAATFVTRDGRNSERVVTAMEWLTGGPRHTEPTGTAQPEDQALSSSVSSQNGDRSTVEASGL